MNSGALSSASTVASGSFDDVVVPHLGAGYRLACWLLRNEDEAEDVVQEASLRAFRYFRTFTGGNGRAWFLRIVRNTCCSWRGRRVHGDMDLFDEEQHSSEDTVCDPETLLVRRATAAAIDEALRHLPTRFRELIVLREMEGLTYREVADAMGIPMGTVMSGLSRARRALRCALDQRTARDPRTVLDQRTVRDQRSFRLQAEGRRSIRL